MLAYVFWHSPRADAVNYGERLARFHRELAAVRPAGFLRSEVFVYSSLPWIEGTPIHEEWYLLEGSAALDVINEAAVAPPLQASHDDVARYAAAGTAGLYRLRSGTLAAGDGIVTHWFAKPDGMTYRELHAMVGSVDGTELWGRQMVLGPTPEFCIRSRDELRLPAQLRVSIFRAKA